MEPVRTPIGSKEDQFNKIIDQAITDGDKGIKDEGGSKNWLTLASLVMHDGVSFSKNDPNYIRAKTLFDTSPDTHRTTFRMVQGLAIKSIFAKR